MRMTVPSRSTASGRSDISLTSLGRCAAPVNLGAASEEGCATEQLAGAASRNRGAPLPSQLTIEILAEESWFPGGVVTALEPAAEQAPAGFEAYRLHTRWGTQLMLWPTGDSDSFDWWKSMLPVGGGGERWGEVPELAGATIERIDAWDGRCWRIRESSGGIMRAHFLPLDSCGHGRRLAGIASEVLEAAVGGLQWQGRDVLLIYRQQQGEAASDRLAKTIEEGDHTAAEQICQASGEALGRFHSDALAWLSLPNDERRWNQRLKRLEEQLVTNTLWRAPHSRDTHATITHRNFGLEGVLLHDDDEPTIANCADGVINAILPPYQDVPAVRDLAAGYRSISSILSNAGGHDIPADLELRLRRALFTGWCATAPSEATSAAALDGHRGGVAIWEYEQVLEEVACALAWKKEVPNRLTDWLSFIPHLQTSMYHSRTLSGLALVSGVSAATALFIPGVFESLSNRIAAAAVLSLCALFLRWAYRRRAPPPY